MASQPDVPPQRRHLIIAGTGRAGTTFLVRYLTALGLDTHLSRRGDNAWLDEAAQAGLEDFPFGPHADDLPYLIKNPMIYEFIDQMIASDELAIDGVIIPVRNLREATSSRVILERRSMTEHQPWLEFMDKAWETSGNVAGGLISSLTALDEARTLAMGFHLLVERLVRANIPMVFLDFPRIVTDGVYLFDKVEPFLPPDATRERARTAHAALADPEKVRIERETGTPAATLDDELDRIALLREITRLRKELHDRPHVVQPPPEPDLEAQRRAVVDIIAAEAERLRAHIAGLETLHAREIEEAERIRALEIEEAERIRARDVAEAESARARDAADAERLRARGIEEAERVRERAAADYEELVACKLQTAQLENDLALAIEQLGIVSEERAALDAQCHRLEDAVTEARNRVIAAEHAMHVYLAPFADDLASLAPAGEGVLVLQILRQRMSGLLEQLDAANDEIAALTARLGPPERTAPTPTAVPSPALTLLQRLLG